MLHLRISAAEEHLFGHSSLAHHKEKCISEFGEQRRSHLEVTEEGCLDGDGCRREPPDRLVFFQRSSQFGTGVRLDLAVVVMYLGGKGIRVLQGLVCPLAQEWRHRIYANDEYKQEQYSYT